MVKDWKYFIGIYVGVLIAALTSIPFLGTNNEWISIVLFATVALLTFMILWDKISPYFSFIIIWDKVVALKKAQVIYNEAKEHGGVLLSTHIYPIERIPSDSLTEDFKNVKSKLHFTRVLYTDDAVRLDQEIRATFSIAESNVEVEVIVPTSGTILPKFIWYVFPRINLTTYFDPKRNKSMSSIGLYRIYTEKNVPKNGGSVSPTIHFFSRRKKLHEKIVMFFGSLKHGHTSHFRSIEEYEKEKSQIIFQARYKSFISRLQVLCENINIGILHTSLFGQYSSYERGVYELGDLKIDFDIDLIVICERGKKETVKRAVLDLVDEMDMNIKVVWGPLNDEFYSKRDPNYLTIDIELFEEGDDYYLTNSLLGHSIIPSCHGIYLQNHTKHRLHQLLSLPEPIPTTKQRAYVLLNNRKGLKDFVNLMDKNDGKYEPIRVISHIVRNTAWVFTGYFEHSYDKTYEFLVEEYPDIFDLEVLNQLKEVVHGTLYLNNQEMFKLSRSIVKTSIKRMKIVLNEN
nr:hypothetical protein [uncultured Draconibacterium sp.]